MRTATPSTTDPATIRPLLHEVTGTGDPIVLVPGAITGWLSFVSLAESLAKSRLAVRVQGRGVEMIGAGEPIPATYGIGEERDALLATVDTLGLDRFDLVGWSLGGGVALAFALDHPNRVRTLTLIEPSAMWLLRQTGHYTAVVADIEAADRAVAGKTITIDALEDFLVRAGIGSPGSAFEHHPRWPVMVRNRQALSLLYIEWNHVDSIDRLRALDVPILMVKGKETADILATIVDVIVATAPNATLLELPGGHACFLENPDEFLQALQSHIAKGGTS